MSLTALAEQLLVLFAGRRDVFSEGKPHRNPEKAALGKLEWFPRHRALEVADVVQHLKGEVRLGIYPVVDDHAQWAAVDFDGDKANVEAGWAKCFAEAKAQQQAFLAKGLLTTIERSQSGAGAHLWLFLDAPMPVGELRTAIDPLILPEVDKDLVYPVQAHGGLPFGNLLALPFYGETAKLGRSVFVDDDGTPIKLADFLRDVHRNSHLLLRDLAADAPRQSHGGRVKGTLAVVDGQLDRPNEPLKRGLLKLISPYGCKFMHHAWTNAATLKEREWWVAMSQCTQLEHGRAAAHALSAPYPGYDPAEVDAKFDRLSTVPVHSCRYIREHWPELACKDCPGKRPVEKAERTLLEMASTGTQEFKRPDWGKAVARSRARRSGALSLGTTWKIGGLDRYTRMRPGELILFGAPPSMGKTAWLIDGSAAQARESVPAFVGSCETGEVGLTDRYLANETGIDSRRIRGEIGPALTVAEEALLDAAMERFSALPLYVNFEVSSPDQLLMLIEERILLDGLRLDQPMTVWFDYLQFGTTGVKIGKQSPYEVNSMLSVQFKLFAKIFHQPTVVFSQLIRSAEGQEAEDAEMNQFKETGRIEADMDEGFILGGPRDHGGIVSRWLRNVKGREGESNYVVPLTMNKTVCRFTDRTLDLAQARVPGGESLESLLPPVGADDEDYALVDSGDEL